MAPSADQSRRGPGAARQASGADITSTALMLHPRWVEMLAERDCLRSSLALLLEKLMEQQRRAEWLETVFQSMLGRHEIERLQAEAEYASLRCQLTLAQALLNRGEAIDREVREQICAAGAQERARWEERIQAQESRVANSQVLLRQAVLVSPEVLAEVKRLYRRLCLRLHPDLAGANNPLFLRYWPLVQAAYRGFDVELLQALDRTVPENAGRAPGGWESLEASIEVLRRQERELLNRLAENEARPPLSYSTVLQDETALASRATEIKDATAALHEKSATIRSRLSALLQNTPQGCSLH